MEEEGRPLSEEVIGGASTHRSEAQGSDLFAALINQLHIQEHKKLNLPDVSQVYRMLVDLGSETAGDIPPELHETIRNVSIAFGFLAFDQLPDGVFNTVDGTHLIPKKGPASPLSMNQ